MMRMRKRPEGLVDKITLIRSIGWRMEGNMEDLLLRCLCGYHAVIPVALMVYGRY